MRERRIIANAQKRVEAHNFDIRKTLLEFDDISNEQRKLIYQQRDYIIENQAEMLLSSVISNYVSDFSEVVNDELKTPDTSLSSYNETINSDFLIDINLEDFTKDYILDIETLKIKLSENLLSKIKLNTNKISDNEYEELIKNISLAVIDEEYRNHLSSMDYLRQSIGLRGYAQKNPKNEYKRESFEMFNYMLMDISKEILKICCRIKIDNYNTNSDKSLATKNNKEFSNRDISRNAPCPCGSGKKYKRCCGKL